MRTLGIIGGMSWTSTAEYYRRLNELVSARLAAQGQGELHSAPLLLHSLDFAEVAAMQQAGEWERAGELLAGVARGLERAGADALLLATNTMHKVAPQIERALSRPFLHIADATGQGVQDAGIRRVGLIATRFTMEQDFYRSRLSERYGLEVLVPGEAERAEVHRVIFEELCRNVLRDESRQRYREVIAGLVNRGAQGIILGCTEITLLVGPADSPVPVFDTTLLHVEAAARFMLADPLAPHAPPATENRPRPEAGSG